MKTLQVVFKTVIEILEKMNSQVRSNMWNSMTHIQPDYLPSIKNK